MLSIEKTLFPRVDLRFDLRFLLPQSELSAASPDRLNKLAHQMILEGSKTHPSNKDFVWIHILPEFDHMIYEFSDPQADDLEACEHVFCRVIRPIGSSAYLSDFAAPSFCGKRAVLLLLHFMALSKIKQMLLTDGSTSLSCCEDGALFSLRTLKIFKTGKGWYEKQGATTCISKNLLSTVFASQVENRFANDLTCKLSDRIIVGPTDFNQFSKLYFDSQYAQIQPDAESAYKKACAYLHGLKIGHLRNSLLSLSHRYNMAEKIKILDQVDQTHTFGELFVQIKNHSFKHEVIDHFVSNKHSIFFSYCCHVLSDHIGTHSSLHSSLAYIILDCFIEKCRDFGIPAEELSLIFCDVLHEPSLTERVLSKRHLTQSYYALYEKNVAESTTSPALVKIRMHSSPINRKKWYEYEKDHGCKGEISALRSALLYLAPRKEQLHDFIMNIPSHLYYFSNKLFEDPEPVYETFMVSKYLCNKRNIFNLTL